MVYIIQQRVGLFDDVVGKEGNGRIVEAEGARCAIAWLLSTIGILLIRIPPLIYPNIPQTECKLATIRRGMEHCVGCASVVIPG